jgi:hypothetical protein
LSDKIEEFLGIDPVKGIPQWLIHTKSKKKSALNSMGKA